MMFGKSNLMSELETFVLSNTLQILFRWVRYRVFFRQRLLDFESNGVVMLQKRWRQIRHLRKAMLLIRCVLAKVQMHRLWCVRFLQRELRRVQVLKHWKEMCDMLALKEKERLRRLEELKREREKRERENRRRKRSRRRRKPGRPRRRRQRSPRRSQAAPEGPVRSRLRLLRKCRRKSVAGVDVGEEGRAIHFRRMYH